LLRANGVDVSINPRDRFYTEQELIDAIKGIDGVFATAHDPFTRKVFNAADRLKVVSRNGVGYDKIDAEAATEKGVCVTLAPIPEHVSSVADSTFTLILSSLRRIPLLDRIARSNNWSGDRFIRFVHDAYGKQLGIIGLGRIGAEVARRARGFDMKVVYYDIVRKEGLEKSLGVMYVSLEDLLGSSDIISINVTLTPHASPSYEDFRALTMTNCDDILRVFRGVKPKYLLNQEVLNKIRLREE